MSPEHPPMPAFKDTLGQGPLGPAKINLVAAYVWGLSNKPRGQMTMRARPRPPEASVAAARNAGDAPPAPCTFAQAPHDGDAPAVNANDPSVVPLVAAPAAEEVSLLEIRKKIYVRAVHGWFAQWRWGLVFATQILFYGLPWLTWNGRQAILFEIAERKFYIFGLVLWPQDVIYLTALLVIAAYSLFLFTAVAGRVWCGYACPQTVYTLIFQWIERKIEGERAARMKLDSSALSASKVAT